MSGEAGDSPTASNARALDTDLAPFAPRYNLREMEVREEMRRAFLKGGPDESDEEASDGAAGEPGE